ncbi:mevalonate kinase [Glonium stellatum]|uniref:Mevalonate kinase n=1 Tax=Glonium stellatum TaxID=574774 RepID=A0A8E2EWD5_9PEZI|nr:mevalonate kinase [Glonium stellatum]
MHSTGGLDIAGLGPKDKKVRKDQLNPTLTTFLVSAPGKVILFGEHAVVYGKTAIAAAISLRSYLLVTHRPKSCRTITLRFPDIGLDHSWRIDLLPWAAFSHPSKKNPYYKLVSTLDSELLEAIKPHLKDISASSPSEARKVHQNAANCFLYLLLSLGSPSFPGCIYTLRSSIPIGAGLGSSASMSVCLSTAFLFQIRALSGPHPDQPLHEARLQVERINNWAFIGELCIHGNASGVDNTVAAQGKAVLFKRPDSQKPSVVTPLPSFPRLPLILVDTRQSKSTAVEIAKVALLKKLAPEITDTLFEAIDKITEKAVSLIKEGDPGADIKANLHQWGLLMAINHCILASLGVSHLRLERIRELVDHTGIGWSKLTGAGGGGFAISLLDPSIPQERKKELESRLHREGYGCFETTLGCNGVGVLWPAVLDPKTDGDAKGIDITEEEFLSVAGQFGVEELVGIQSRTGESGWMFWASDA